jgi:mitochondrial fission protein ELM1
MRNLLRFYLNRVSAVPSPGWLRLFYAMPDLPADRCDLIVSSGGKTSFANVWLAKRLGLPNVFIGSLRRLSAEFFTVVLTMEPVNPPNTANLVLELPPSTVDDGVARRQGHQLRHDLQLRDQRLFTLLLGGDGAGYRFSARDWEQLGQLLKVLGERHQARWLILGSRRTGAEAEKIIGSTVTHELIARSAWYEPGKSLDISSYLGAAEQVFVTEDSMTMVTEAIYSQRPVISLRPVSVSATRRYEAMMQRFAEQRWICRYAVAALLEEPGQFTGLECSPLTASPLEDLSQQLARRLQL